MLLPLRLLHVDDALPRRRRPLRLTDDLVVVAMVDAGRTARSVPRRTASAITSWDVVVVAVVAGPRSSTFVTFLYHIVIVIDCRRRRRRCCWQC